MSLLIPTEFAREINTYSNYFNSKSKWAGKTTKALFRSPPNLRYLSKGLYDLITHPLHIKKNMPTSVMQESNTNVRFTGPHDSEGIIKNKATHMANGFRNSQKFLDANIEELVEMHPLPYLEDMIVENPIQQLHLINRDFLLKSSRNIIQCPEMIMPRFFAINPETGADESKVEYDYTSESYADGTWHPEHLFTNSQRNHANPYWIPVETSFYTDPDEKGPGHRYYSKQYAATQRTRSQFPRWQYSAEDTPLETDIDEALREGGHSDRRVQRNRGYNMSSLVYKSTY
jgi:hypothetical protein